MMTLRNFSRKPETIPAMTSWYLADLGEWRGKQELFTRQAPQKLKVLREHALIESAVSSNRIEGVETEQKRIHTLIFGKPLLKDRDEEEIRGYRDALNFIHGQGANIPISEETVLKLHQMIRGEIWDAGKYKEKDGDIIEKYADGRQRVRFKTVKAEKTPEAIRKLIEIWNECLDEKWVHPLIALPPSTLISCVFTPFEAAMGVSPAY